jgi:hypothetical protein
MDAGFRTTTGTPVTNPLPVSWLGLPDAPLSVPSTSNFNRLTVTEIKNLQAQIAYDLSEWDYKKVGPNNELGRYQFDSVTLEEYGFLQPGSNSHFGNSCVNYVSCWTGTAFASKLKSGFLYNIHNASNFLISQSSQEHLAYQRLYDLYQDMTKNQAITDADTNDIVAGMLYVGWALGAGNTPTADNRMGTGAWAWRNFAVGNAANQYNSGRYAVAVLSQ